MCKIKNSVITQFGVVWMAMGDIFVTRKSYKTCKKNRVKSPEFMSYFTFVKAIQWATLAGADSGSWALCLTSLDYANVLESCCPWTFQGVPFKIIKKQKHISFKTINLSVYPPQTRLSNRLLWLFTESQQPQRSSISHLLCWCCLWCNPWMSSRGIN